MTPPNDVTPLPRPVSRTQPGDDELAAQAELEARAHAIAAIEGDASDLDTTPIEVVSADELVEEEEACA